MAKPDRPNGMATLAERLLAFDPAKKLDTLLASDVAKLAKEHASSIQRLETDAAMQFRQMESDIVQQAKRHHETIASLEASLRPAMNYGHLAQQVLATEQPWIKEFERMKNDVESMSLGVCRR
jgi:hypothetical protein